MYKVNTTILRSSNAPQIWIHRAAQITFMADLGMARRGMFVFKPVKEQTQASSCQMRP